MSEPLFGPHRTVLSSIHEMSPEVIDQIAQAVEMRGIRVPISNVPGYQQLTPKSVHTSGAGAALGTTVSAAFADMPSGADQIANLRAGSYLIFFSARVTVDVVGNTGVIGIRVNAVDPGGATTASGDHFLFNCTQPTTNAQIIYTTLTGDTSTVKLRWLVTGGTATVYEYTLSCLKIGN